MLKRFEILNWLREDNPARLTELYSLADQTRRSNVGDDVHLRGLIELSNHCVRQCTYCGLRGPNHQLPRYRMEAHEVLACARQAMAFGYGTVVLQAGEDPGIERNWLTELITQIKAIQPVAGGPSTQPLAITLSLGERSTDDLAAWKAAGADRYLLRFETSNRKLFEHIHPSLPDKASDRIAILRQLRQLGYEVGSGVMIGIPGQSYEDLADDIITFHQLGLDMIGVGPFLPHPQTPLGMNCQAEALDLTRQVPNSEDMTYKMLALTRLTCPRANIPSTTALATLNRQQGRELGLMRGANIVMPNLTPIRYRAMYEIYPDKACVNETADQCQLCLAGRVASIGRGIGKGRGDSPNKLGRSPSTPVPGSGT